MPLPFTARGGPRPPADFRTGAVSTQRELLSKCPNPDAAHDVQIPPRPPNFGVGPHWGRGAVSHGSIQRFRSVIESAGGGGAFVSVPFDVEAVFGKNRVPVKATIDGEPYQGTLVRMGGPCHMLIVLKHIRLKIGKGPGDPVDVVVEEDLDPRVVEIPDDLAKALGSQPRARQFFDGLPYTNQKEYVQWIVDAKREETRAIRVSKAVAMLRNGKKSR